MASEYAFSIHYDRDGNPVDCTLPDENGDDVKYTYTLPADVDIKPAETATVILVGTVAGRYCRWVWIPPRGWQWICE